MGNSITVVNSNLATVASNITNVNNVGGSIANVNTVAGISANVTTVAGISANTTTVAGISSDVTSVAGVASNVTSVAGITSDVTTVAGISANVTSVAGVASNVTTVAGIAANVTTVANNVAGVNSFAERYRVGSSDPTTSLDAGDLAYNTTDNALKYYNGSSWASITAGLTDVVGDVTPQLGGDLDVNGNSIVSASNGNISITPNGSGKVIIDGLSHPTADGSAGQFITTDGSGTLSFGDVPAGVGGATGVDFNDNVTARFGTGNDLTLRHSSSDNNSYIEESGSGALIIKTNNLQVQNAAGTENMIVASENGAVSLRYDNSTKLNTNSSGVAVTGTLQATNLNITDSTYGAKVQMTTSDTSNPVTAGTENNGQLAYLQNNKNLYLYQDNKSQWRAIPTTNTDVIMEKVTPPLSQGTSIGFGMGSCALSGDGNYLVVGAWDSDIGQTRQGRAYVFAKNADGSWDYQAAFTGSTSGYYSRFGYAVDINYDGTYIAAGSYTEGAGAVYIFTRSGTTWTEQAEINASGASASDYHGLSVSLSSDATYLAAGATGDDDEGTNRGLVTSIHVLALLGQSNKFCVLMA